MLHQFYFSKLLEPINDGIEPVSEGLFVRLSNHIIKEYKPIPQLKVFAQDANFF